MTEPANERAREPAVDRQIVALHRRTVVVGCLACLTAILALLTSARTLFDLNALVLSEPGIPAFHLPPALRAELPGIGLSWLVVALAIIGAWGVSTGRLRRELSYLAVLLCVMVALADLLLAAPVHSPLFVIPSKIERAVATGNYNAVDRLIDETERALEGTAEGLAQLQRVRYVKAQVALRRGDTEGLEELVRPILLAADDYVYTAQGDIGKAAGYGDTLGDLSPAVLAALDRGTPAGPMSMVALEYPGGQSALDDAGPGWLRIVLTLGVALALLAAAVALTLLWRVMCANLHSIHELILGDDGLA